MCTPNILYASFVLNSCCCGCRCIPSGFPGFVISHVIVSGGVTCPLEANILGFADFKFAPPCCMEQIFSCLYVVFNGGANRIVGAWRFDDDSVRVIYKSSDMVQRVNIATQCSNRM
jgi:hypothetical protein